MHKKTRMCLVASLVVAGTITACQSAPSISSVDSKSWSWETENPGPVPDRETAIQTATTAIRYQLKDPESAEFRNWTSFFKARYRVAEGKIGSAWGICVEVNAKNSFGGYTGYEWMYVNIDNNQAVEVGDGKYVCTTAPSNPARREPR